MNKKKVTSFRARKRGGITAGAFSLIEILVTIAIIGILYAMMMGRAMAQQTISPYLASPTYPNSGIYDTNDFPFTITNGGMTVIPQSTNVPNNVFILRQNVGLSCFASFTVTNANTATTNGFVEFWIDFSPDGLLITGVTNGVWDGLVTHAAVFICNYSVPPASTNTFTCWTNFPATWASNVRDARITGITNSLPTGVKVNQFAFSQSQQ